MVFAGNRPIVAACGGTFSGDIVCKDLINGSHNDSGLFVSNNVYIT